MYVCVYIYTHTHTHTHTHICGPGSSVGIATELRAGRSGIECRCGRDLPPVQTGPGAHPATCKMGTGSFPGVKCDRGVLLTTHPLLVQRSWKSRAIPLPTLSGPHRACNGITLHLYIYIYILLHCGPTWVLVSQIWRFLDHTQRRITVDRTPLDE